MTARRIFNLSFTKLDSSAIALLSKTGLTRHAEWDEDSRLPFLRTDLEPEEIEKAVADTVDALNANPEDIVIAGGVPDVVCYIDKFLPLDVTLLTMLGRKINGQFTIQGFRELIRDERPDDGMKAIHVTR